jgi:hypothetical protein
MTPALAIPSRREGETRRVEPFAGLARLNKATRF